MSAPYASDYTAIVHRRGRLAKANDLDLTGLPGGGLDLQAAGLAAVGPVVAALVVVPVWLMFVPLSLWLALPVAIVAWVPLYWLFQKETEGRESILQTLQIVLLRSFRQPKYVAGMAADKEPTHFMWEAIVARTAGSEAPAMPVRQYEHYGYDGDLPTAPIQGRQWPAFDEPVTEWQFRVWWESGGELLDGRNDLDSRNDQERAPAWDSQAGSSQR